MHARMLEGRRLYIHRVFMMNQKQNRICQFVQPPYRRVGWREGILAKTQVASRAEWQIQCILISIFAPRRSVTGRCVLNLERHGAVGWRVDTAKFARTACKLSK